MAVVEVLGAPGCDPVGEVLTVEVLASVLHALVAEGHGGLPIVWGGVDDVLTQASSVHIVDGRQVLVR